MAKRKCKRIHYNDIYHKHFRRYYYHALERKICFEITMQDAWEQYIKQDKKCAITGLELVWSDFSKNGNASIDRIDSSIGYTKENIHIVHKWVNVMKNDFDLDEFKTYCIKCYLNSKPIGNMYQWEIDSLNTKEDSCL